MTEQQPQAPSIVRTALWVALIVCAVGNAALSLNDASTTMHLALAVLTTLCLAGLIVSHVRKARSR